MSSVQCATCWRDIYESQVQHTDEDGFKYCSEDCFEGRDQ